MWMCARTIRFFSVDAIAIARVTIALVPITWALERSLDRIHRET
jgi:hypothetical protein